MSIEPSRREPPSPDRRSSWAVRGAIGALFTVVVLVVAWQAKADPDLWVEKFRQRTSSIDGLPTRPTDRYFAGEA